MAEMKCGGKPIEADQTGEDWEERLMLRTLTIVLAVALLALVTMAWATSTVPITGADNLAATPSTAGATTFTHVALPNGAAPATTLTQHVAAPAPPKTVAVATTEPTTAVGTADGKTAVAHQNEVAPDTRKSVAHDADIGGGLGSMKA